jgi:very-short-patch-repair endonuclease
MRRKRKPPGEKKQSEKSRLEEEFYSTLLKLFPDIPRPERQYKFHPTRLWRFDFAWPELKVAVEIQGGAFMRRKGRGGRGGGHTTAIGQAKDYEKHREAAVRGWKLLPFNSHELQKKLDKGKVTKTGKIKRHRKFTMSDCVMFVGELVEYLKAMELGL